MTKIWKNMGIAIAAFLIGCIVCSIMVASMYDQEIEDLSDRLRTANTRYEDMYHAAEIVTNDLVDMVEFKYDELIDITDSMNSELDDAGLDIIEYDDRYFTDVFDDWADRIDPYMEFIIEKCDLD